MNGTDSDGDVRTEQALGEIAETLRETNAALRRVGRGGWLGGIVRLAGFGLSILLLLLFLGGIGGGPSYSLDEVSINAVEIPGEKLPVPAGVRGSKEGTFVIVSIYGPIVEGPQLSGMLGQLREASEADGVEAVILRVASPGGTVSASEDLRREILRLKKRVKVVSLYEFAASGAVFSTVETDAIIATRSAMVGSIGVIFSWANFSGFMTEHGLKLEVVKSGTMKDVGSYARNPSAEETAMFQRMVDESFERFVSLVAVGRGMEEEDVLKIANGSIYSAADAQRIGLVDRVSDEPLRDAVLQAMAFTGVTDPRLLEAQQIQGFGGGVGSFAKLLSRDAGIEERVVEAVSAGPSLRYEWRPLSVSPN